MLCKHRTKRQTFPLRTPITCPLGFCATTGFPFGACVTAELEGGKKDGKILIFAFELWHGKYSFHLPWYCLFQTQILACEPGELCPWYRMGKAVDVTTGNEFIASHGCMEPMEQFFVLLTGRGSAIVTQLFLLCCRSRISHNVLHLVVADLSI